MSKLTFATLGSVLLALATVEARADFVLPPGVTCPDPGTSSVDMNCSFVYQQQEERELNRVYNALLSTLGSDEAKDLRRSQKAWLAFRAADVSSVVRHYGEGGSQGRSIAAWRSFELTRVRVKDLQRRLSGADKW
jgi:uncharacterized protein YecT (DUF1311 family)